MTSNKKTRMRFAHISLCDMLTTRDPIDDDSITVAGSIYSNSMSIEFCQVRKLTLDKRLIR